MSGSQPKPQPAWHPGKGSIKTYLRGRTGIPLSQRLLRSGILIPFLCASKKWRRLRSRLIHIDHRILSWFNIYNIIGMRRYISTLWCWCTFLWNPSLFKSHPLKRTPGWGARCWNLHRSAPWNKRLFHRFSGGILLAMTFLYRGSMWNHPYWLEVRNLLRAQKFSFSFFQV